MTTPTSAYSSITHTILEGNLCCDGRPTRAAVERLAQETRSALASAFPGAEVRVEVAWRTQGVSPADRFQPAATTEDEMYACLVTQTAWEAWCQSLTDDEMEA